MVISATTPGLTELELGAWRSFLRAHAQITRKLEADLVAEHDLPLPSYDVLLQLAEAPERRLRMTDLADRVLLSRSGLTRLVDRLEREGLVERTACPNDARGTNAVLTDGGLSRLRTAAPTHLRGVSEHVTSRLDAEELDQLRHLMLKLMTEHGPLPEGGCGAAEGVR
ncbi:MAG: transcriptional regulator, MarR family [Frankiales bacterium]|nr:transcriptional regulator, MarR family [Frankiales bacterium]